VESGVEPGKLHLRQQIRTSEPPISSTGIGPDAGLLAPRRPPIFGGNPGRRAMKTTFRDPSGAFEVQLPVGWEVEADEEGGLLLGEHHGCGLLHLIQFDREPGEEADPAEELYAFLEDQEIELEEDEVEDVGLGGGGSLAVCEYLSEEGEEIVYWLVGVATAPGQLLFASYSCPHGEEEQEKGRVREILASLSFVGP
jgi:hypothetical protein